VSGGRADGQTVLEAAPAPESGAARRRFAISLWIIFLGALLIRVFYLWELRDADVSRILIGDGYLYDRWAREIARGDWLGHDVFYQAPLYPYFLAVVHWLLGPRLLVVRLVQALLGAVACVLLGLAGRSFFSPTVGLIAGGILAVYAPAVFFDGLIQKTVLDLVLATALLWLLAGLRSDGPGVRIVAAGLTLGLLCLTRENALLLIPVAGVWIVVALGTASTRRRLGHAALFLAGLAMVLGPVALRNRVVGGEWFLTTAQLGPNFYIGNHSRANGLYSPLRAGRGDARFERQDAIELAQAALGHPLTAGEVSRYWTARTLAEIRADPGHWLRLLGWKLALTWNTAEVIDTEAPEVYADSSVLLRVLGWLAHFGTVAPLAAVGLWITRRQWRRLWLLYAMLVTVTLSVTLFYVFARYRYILVPVLVMFAASGIAGIVAAWRQRRWRDVALAGGLVAIVAVAVNLPLVRDQRARAVMYINMGTTLGSAGQPDEAIRYYRKAIAVSPSYVAARLILARTLVALGRKDEAVGEYMMALAIAPHLPEAESGLAALLLGGASHPPAPATPR